MLIERAQRLSDQSDSSDGTEIDSSDSSDGANYSMASATGAMYILVANTAPDLRAGFSLLVDGWFLHHRIFGVVLLTLFWLMLTAAMRVLFYSAGDDASVVINAVTVLFIAELVSYTSLRTRP